MASALADDMDGVALAHHPAAQHPREHALAGHDAVAHGLVDVAFVVAFLADLGDFEERRAAHGQARAHGQQLHGDALGGQVLGEVAGHEGGHLLLHPADALDGQQADLALPAAVGVARHPVVLAQLHAADLLLALVLDRTDAHRVNGAHVSASRRFWMVPRRPLASRFPGLYPTTLVNFKPKRLTHAWAQGGGGGRWRAQGAKAKGDSVNSRLFSQCRSISVDCSLWLSRVKQVSKSALDSWYIFLE